jgi:CBS domain-containing protein
MARFLRRRNAAGRPSRCDQRHAEENVKAQELMTINPACVTPDDTASRAAQLMADHDCGCLPVVSSQDDCLVVGVVTDRDIVLRGVRNGHDGDATVRDLMTAAVHCCRAGDDLSDVERTMADRQVRRVVIVDDGDRVVGMISQADLARAAERGRDVTDREVAIVVERISEPAPRRPTH